MTAPNELICAKWLGAPTNWRWPPSQPREGEDGGDGPAVGGGEGMDVQFVSPDNVLDGKLHWLRHGLLCFVLVTKEAEYQVLGVLNTAVAPPPSCDNICESRYWEALVGLLVQDDLRLFSVSP